MSKFKGANGKWEFIDTDMDPRMYQYAIVNESGVKLVAMIVKSSRDAEYALANAKLIAAAPDMLKALESIQDILYSPGLIDAGDLRRITDSAIKKATGDE